MTSTGTFKGRSRSPGDLIHLRDPVDPRQIAVEVILGRDAHARHVGVVVLLGRSGTDLQVDAVVEVAGRCRRARVEGRTVLVHRAEVERRLAQVLEAAGERGWRQRCQVVAGDVAERLAVATNCRSASRSTPRRVPRTFNSPSTRSRTRRPTCSTRPRWWSPQTGSNAWSIATPPLNERAQKLTLGRSFPLCSPRSSLCQTGAEGSMTSRPFPA